MRELLNRAARGLTMGVLAMLAFMTTADAAVYRGVWDPPYGPTFPNIGWRGEIEIDAPTNCGAASGYSGTVSCGSGAATVSFAFVELYYLNDPTLPEPLTQSLLTFAPASIAVSSLQFTSGVLTGAITSRSGWVHDSLLDVDFALQFVLAGMPSSPGLPNVPGASTYSGPVLWYKDKVCLEEHHKRGDYDHDDECECYKTVYGVNDLSETGGGRPTLTFTEVPEPGSLALVIAAVLMGGGLRSGSRRRV